MTESTFSVSTPVSPEDPVNARILRVSEDCVQGFHARPFDAIADASGVELPVVLQRIAAMLEAGTIRRVRQTLLATNLSPGALVAWIVPSEKLSAAFDWMFTHDPFTGHVVIRTTDGDTPGSQYRLWTTLKVPSRYDMDKHCRLLMVHTGATGYRLMPARCVFSLGVGHMRRRVIEPGDKTDEPGRAYETNVVALSDEDWRVLTPLKRELAAQEIISEPWRDRAAEAGMSHQAFCAVAESLNARGVIGRFSTFLEHVKPVAGNQRVTRFNALFHWAVPPGREMETGREVGRFMIMTHAYWRQGGPDFNNVNIMGVAHGLEKPKVLEHKASIDAHLADVGIPVSYTNVFWGGRSEIKPSEIAPRAYADWCGVMGVEPVEMEKIVVG